MNICIYAADVAVFSRKYCNFMLSLHLKTWTKSGFIYWHQPPECTHYALASLSGRPRVAHLDIFSPVTLIVTCT